MNACSQLESVSAYAMQAMPAAEVPAFEAHLSSCEHCRRELQALRPVVDAFAAWPVDVLRPTASLQGRLAQPIAAETGKAPVLPPAQRYQEPEWEEVAPGIFCKLLTDDAEQHRVRPRRRALDRRSQAVPGGYRAEAPTSDKACLERDRLHLRPHHQHERHSQLTMCAMTLWAGERAVPLWETGGTVLWPLCLVPHARNGPVDGMNSARARRARPRQQKSQKAFDTQR